MLTLSEIDDACRRIEDRLTDVPSDRYTLLQTFLALRAIAGSLEQNVARWRAVHGDRRELQFAEAGLAQLRQQLELVQKPEQSGDDDDVVEHLQMAHRNAVECATLIRIHQRHVGAASLS